RAAGSDIPAGGRVGVLLGAANRDADVFPDAQAFQAQRAPNRHLAFGVGPHFCIGARLAKMQAQVVLRELLLAGSQIGLAMPHETIEYLPTSAVRGPSRLEIQLSR